MQENDTVSMTGPPTPPSEKWVCGRAPLPVSRAGITDPEKGGSYARSPLHYPALKGYRRFSIPTAQNRPVFLF
ncbi:MAG: hypothetical protein CVV34_00740 [Methanomicrobiales archaeon HGW-Methanomicrobiales-5]|nr:MAG: hypothetical protein CVV34_00740 [Methanomicrobiales archaeon HGW-Methanomicrobiales-5]